MTKILFVINPRSGNTNVEHFVSEAKASLTGHAIHFFVPQNFHEYSEVSRIARKLNADLLVTVGGDGTTNLLLDQLAQSGKPVYFFPCGTANDLAKSVGHSDNWISIANSALLLDQAPLDLITVNGKSFSTVGGIGIGAVLTEEMNSLRLSSQTFNSISKKLKKHTYSVLAFQIIAQKKFKNFKIELESTSPQNPQFIQTEIFESAVLLVGNQSFLGGNLQIQQCAKNNDGQFEIFALKKRSPLKLIEALIQMRRGIIPCDTVLRTVTGAKIRILGGEKTSFFADGENIEFSDTFELQIKQNAIKVLQTKALA